MFCNFLQLSVAYAFLYAVLFIACGVILGLVVFIILKCLCYFLCICFAVTSGLLGSCLALLRGHPQVAVQNHVMTIERPNRVEAHLGNGCKIVIPRIELKDNCLGNHSMKIGQRSLGEKRQRSAPRFARKINFSEH